MTIEPARLSADPSTLFCVTDALTFAPRPKLATPATTAAERRYVTESQRMKLLEAITAHPDGLTFIQMDFVEDARFRFDGHRKEAISALLADGFIVAIPERTDAEWPIYTTPENWQRVASKRVATCQEPALYVPAVEATQQPNEPADVQSKPVKSIHVKWHDSNQVSFDARRILRAVHESKKIRRPLDLARQFDISLERVTMAVAALECQRLVMQTAYANGLYITPTSHEQQIEHVLEVYHIEAKLD